MAVVKILIVDKDLSPIRRHGAVPIGQDNLKVLLDLVRAEHPEVLVLDATASTDEGLSALALLRAEVDLPVVAIIADPAAEVRFLRAGAADCLMAPIDLLEFSEHLGAVRRKGGQHNAHGRPDLLVYHFAGLVFHASQRAVGGAEGHLVQLTTSEARLLVHFVQHQQLLCTRASLEEAVYGRNRPASERAIDMLLNRLRKKLRTIQGPNDADLIRTDFRLGYMLMTTVLAQRAAPVTPSRTADAVG